MQPNTRPDFPMILRSSFLSDWGLCETKGYWAWLRNQVPRSSDPNLHAGAAFAKGLEISRRAFFEERLSQDEALCKGIEAMWRFYGDFEPPEDNPKSWQRLTGALVFYATERPFAEDPVQPLELAGKPAIEFTFAIPLDVLHPVTGEPILYTGRFDMIGRADGVLWCVDEKTTRQLGSLWAHKWDLRGQFLGYMWAAQEHGIPVQGICVRGIAIRKEGFDFAEAFCMPPRSQIDDWLRQLYKTIERMKTAWAENWFDQNGILSGACSFFQGCPYKQLCKSQQPEAWLATNFVSRQPTKTEEDTL